MDPLIPHMRNVFYLHFALFIKFYTGIRANKPRKHRVQFYKSYLKEESSDNSRFLSQYVSDELMKSINDSMM